MATETHEPIRTVRPESVENGQGQCPGFSYEEGAKKTSTWITYKRKRETPASDSQSAKTKMGQNMALVHQSLSLLANDSRHVEPQTTVRPESVENGQEKCPGFFYQEGAKKTTTWITYTRKRGRLAGSKSAKSKIEQKSVLFDDNINRSSYSNVVDKDENFVPHTPTRKRRRPTCSKCSKRKVERKPQLVERSSSSEGNKDNNNAFEPDVSHDDDVRKKNAREQKADAWDQAVELKKKLRAKGLCFIKSMKRSQVSGGYWLGLPAESCRNHLPTHDVNIVLEDEEGQKYNTKYIAERTGLSGGWRGFAKKLELKVSDALVFQLVSQVTFKVYILRADGELSLPSLDTCMGNNKSSKKREKEASDEDAKSKKKRKVLRKKRKVLRRKASGDRSDELATTEAAGGGIRSPVPYTNDFVAVKSFEDFKIAVGDGLLALPDRMCMTYYHLCKARKAFFHRQASPTSATEMIVETIKIADGIRASSSLASLEEDLAAWKKTLASFEPQGMDVAFMRERVDGLLGLLGASTAVEPEGHEEVKAARAHAAKRLRVLESRVSVLKDTLKEIDAEIEASVRKKKDQAVRNLATAPLCVDDPGTPGSDTEAREMEDSSIGKTKTPRAKRKRATRLPGWLAGHEFDR